MEIKGTVTTVFPEQSGTNANGFTWRSQDFKVIQYIDAVTKAEYGMVLTVRNSKIDELQIRRGMKGVFKFSSTISDYKDRAFDKKSCYAVEVEGHSQAEPKSAPSEQNAGAQPTTAVPVEQNASAMPNTAATGTSAQVEAAKASDGLPF